MTAGAYRGEVQAARHEHWDGAAGERCAKGYAHSRSGRVSTARPEVAELAVGAGWLGLRSHPRPAASFTLGGSTIPTWFDGALREVIGAAKEER